jgi:acetylornithine deacetylase/succinyl-diaminopimelate desuccinylase-like protein
VAAGERRLGSFLSPTSGAPRTPDGLLREALEVLSATPAPHGGERAAAQALVAWGQDRLPGLAWTVAEHGDGASVVVTLAGSGPVALLLASHLDTSLSGNPAEDAAVTGRSDAPSPLRFDGDDVSGFGLGVARAPAAAAVAGLARAAAELAGRDHRAVQLLLAGSGTHRSALPAHLPGGSARPSSSAGALTHLRDGPRPGAVLIAKGGPPTVLRSEPGACYLQLTVTGRWGAALSPASADPEGGVLLHAGTVLGAVADWRTAFVAARRGRDDGLGGEAGIGAVTAGRPDKPDLLPAVLDLRLYVVTVPGDEPVALADELAVAVRAALGGTPLASCDVAVTAEPLHPAGTTPAAAPVVAAAERAWRTHRPGPPAELRDWTGSTDGTVFRAAGIDTARTGPATRPDDADPRRDRLSLAELESFAAIYADVAVELATA